MGSTSSARRCVATLVCGLVVGCAGRGGSSSSPPRSPPSRLELHPVADLESDLRPRRISVLSPKRWAVTGRWSALVHDPTGSRTLYSGGGTWRAFAHARGVVYGRDLHPWRAGDSQRLPIGIGFDDGVKTIQTSVHYGSSWWATSVALSGARTKLEVVVSAQAFGGSGADWARSFPGRGTAAIAPDGRIAVVMSDGTFRVLRVGDTDHAVTETGGTLPGEPYAIAIVGKGYAVLTATQSEEGSRERNRPMRLYDTVDSPGPWQWETKLLALDADGNVRWETPLGFQGWGRPQATDENAMWVLGRGVAHVDAGRVTWSRPSQNWTRGLAYANGSLAVASGAQLEVLEPDGSTADQTQSPDGTDFLTPPTAGAGRLWIATATHLYATR